MAMGLAGLEIFNRGRQPFICQSVMRFAMETGAGDDRSKSYEETKMFRMQSGDQVLSATQLRRKRVVEFLLIQICEAAWLVDARGMEDSRDRTDFRFDVFDRLRNLAGIGNIDGEILKGNSAGRETSEI